MIQAWLSLLPLALVPASVLLALLHAPAVWVFAAGGAGIIPLSAWIRRATEQIAERAGPAIGGLVNVTFGNAAEFVLALFVLRSGNTGVVKATITGSIIGNSLLGLGLAILAGSVGRDRQTFPRERAGLLASLLILSVIALLLPALFDYAERALVTSTRERTLDERLSLGVSIVLIVVYVANLFYTLVTHRDIFAGSEEQGTPEWSLAKAVGVLAAATAAVAVEAELVSGALEATAQRLGVSLLFVGVIVLPLVGNTAEYVSALYFARRDRMGLVMTISLGSSIQIALLTAPALVLGSYVFGHPMDLVFAHPLELMSIAGSAFVVNAIALDGETNWFEGVMLVAVYVLLALAFFFATGTADSAAALH
jgi:Ca2+:H+ antiporter